MEEIEENQTNEKTNHLLKQLQQQLELLQNPPKPIELSDEDKKSLTLHSRYPDVIDLEDMFQKIIKSLGKGDVNRIRQSTSNSYDIIAEKFISGMNLYGEERRPIHKFDSNRCRGEIWIYKNGCWRPDTQGFYEEGDYDDYIKKLFDQYNIGNLLQTPPGVIVLKHFEIENLLMRLRSKYIFTWSHMFLEHIEYDFALYQTGDKKLIFTDKCIKKINERVREGIAKNFTIKFN